MSTWNKIKNFLIGGAIATLGIGGASAVKYAVKDKPKIEAWKNIHPDADSIYADPDDGYYYAEKKGNGNLDTVALKKLRIDEMKLEKQEIKLKKQKQDLIDSANKMFTKALKKKDYKGVENAIYEGASVSGKDLIQMIKDPSEEAYHIARYFIKIGVDTRTTDGNGSTARDYAAALNTVRGETLKREIDEQHNVFKPVETPKMSEIDREVSEINKKLDKISQSMEDVYEAAYGYTDQGNINGYSVYRDYKVSDGNTSVVKKRGRFTLEGDLIEMASTVRKYRDSGK